jgi:acylphosphatase
VRNCADGSVEAVFEGSREQVEGMVDFCREGPRGAQVEQVERHDEAAEGLTGFSIA